MCVESPVFSTSRLSVVTDMSLTRPLSFSIHTTSYIKWGDGFCLKEGISRKLVLSPVDLLLIYVYISKYLDPK